LVALFNWQKYVVHRAFCFKSEWVANDGFCGTLDRSKDSVLLIYDDYLCARQAGIVFLQIFLVGLFIFLKLLHYHFKLFLLLLSFATRTGVRLGKSIAFLEFSLLFLGLSFLFTTFFIGFAIFIAVIFIEYLST